MIKSKCCNAEVHTSEFAPDFIGDDPKTMRIGTCSYICNKCNKACDVIGETKGMTLDEILKEAILYYGKARNENFNQVILTGAKVHILQWAKENASIDEEKLINVLMAKLTPALSIKALAEVITEANPVMIKDGGK